MACITAVELQASLAWRGGKACSLFKKASVSTVICNVIHCAALISYL